MNKQEAVRKLAELTGWTLNERDGFFAARSGKDVFYIPDRIDLDPVAYPCFVAILAQKIDARGYTIAVHDGAAWVNYQIEANNWTGEVNADDAAHAAMIAACKLLEARKQ